MPYVYKTERGFVFTEDGVAMLMKMFSNIRRKIDSAGAVSMSKVLSGLNGDSWSLMAVVDYLVEVDMLREVTGGDVAGQQRIFVKGSKFDGRGD